MLKTRFTAAPLLWVLIAGVVTQLHGQSVTTSTLLGSVVDNNGAAVAGANVRVTEEGTGASRAAVTDREGNYTIPYLPPGVYRVEVERAGFKKSLRGNVTLTVGVPLRVDAALETGLVTDTVEVVAESPVLKTERADISQSFSTKQVRELPIANRNYQSLAGLLPGVSPPSVDFTQLEDPQGTTFFRANGQGNSANNTLVDGADNINPTLGLTIYIPPPRPSRRSTSRPTTTAPSTAARAARSSTSRRGAGLTRYMGASSSSTATPPCAPATSSTASRSQSRASSATSSAAPSAARSLKTGPSFSPATRGAI